MASFDLVPLFGLHSSKVVCCWLQHLAGLSVALVVGVLQSATGIHEPLIGMVPRLVVMVAVIFMTGGWMIERFVSLFQASVLSP